MARNATTAVPWILCHDLELCAAVNSNADVVGNAADGSDGSDGPDKVVCTINDVWMDTPKFHTPAGPVTPPLSLSLSLFHLQYEVAKSDLAANEAAVGVCKAGVTSLQKAFDAMAVASTDYEAATDADLLAMNTDLGVSTSKSLALTQAPATGMLVC